jgi:hypothetical protein
MRASFIRMSYLELEAQANAAAPGRRQSHSTAIDTLTSPDLPFTNCLRSFERLYRSDRARAAAIAEECLKFMRTKSVRRRKT